jgi:hypothetical protein
MAHADELDASALAAEARMLFGGSDAPPASAPPQPRSLADRLTSGFAQLREAAGNVQPLDELRSAAAKAKAAASSESLRGAAETLGDKAKLAAQAAKAKASVAADRMEAGAARVAGGLASAGSALRDGVSEGLQRVQALTQERLLAFFMLASAAALMLALAFLVGLPAAPLAPSKFAIPFTLGSLFNIGALAALRGVSGQVKHMTASERLPVSLVYVSSMLATLWAAFAMHSYILCIALSIIQLIALVYYTVSYFPGGMAGFRLISMSSGRVLRHGASLCWGCVQEAKETRSLGDLLPM